MEPRLTRELGYIVDGPTNTVTAPFYWRQTHWMRFDSAGGVAPIGHATKPVTFLDRDLLSHDTIWAAAGS